MTTRNKYGISKPNAKYALLTFTIPTELKPVKFVLKNDGWKAAMIKETKALATNDTWELVLRSSNMYVVGCCWVFKTKLRSNGGLERLKAHLVAKGFNKKEGDFS